MLGEITMATDTHIFIGFGGSGCKTLTQLCALLSDDAKLCGLADSKYFFLFVDTDLDDVKKYCKLSKESLSRGAVKPFCELVHISANSDKFSEMVPKHFCPAVERGVSYGADDKIKSHWWHDEAGSPFDAPKLTASLETGAGQCPPVAYFLSWKNVETLNKALGECIDQMVHRQMGTARQEIRTTLHLCAGLSGGTGRGCWHLLSLRAREILRAKSIQSQAVGYFYDQSIMRDVIEGNKVRQSQMMLNSLSGISELLMWIRNDAQKERKSNYILPDASSPTDEEVAVTNMTRISEIKTSRGWSPIEVAWLIGGDSRSVPTLGNQEAYYEMVGGFMYSRLLNSQIKSGASNEPANLGSVAAAMCVVPTVDIGKWLVKEAGSRLADSLLGESSGSSFLPSAIADLAKLTAEDLNGNGQSEGGKWYQSARSKVQEKLGVDASLAQFEKLLKAQDVRKAGELKKSISDESGAGPTDLASEFRHVLHTDQFNGLGVEEYFKECMDKAGGLKNSQRSLSETRKACLAIAMKLRGFASVELKRDKSSSVEQLNSYFEEAKKKEGLFGIGGIYFNDLERGTLRAKAATVLGHDVSMTTCLQLADALAAAAKDAERLENSVTTTMASLGKAAGIGATAPSDASSQTKLFTKSASDLDHSFNDESFLKARCAKRIFRPVWNEKLATEAIGAVLRYAEDVPAFKAAKEKLDRRIRELAIGAEVSERDSGRIEREIRESLDEMKKMLSAPVKVLENAFSFERVLRELVPFWVEQMNAARGPRQLALRKTFLSLFGFDCPQLEGRFTEPAQELVLQHLAADLAAACDPFIRFKNETEAQKRDGDEVKIFLPQCDGWDKNFAKRVQASEAFLSHKLGTTAKVIAAGEEEGTPFALVAIAEEKINYDAEDPNKPDHRHIDATITLSYWNTAALKTKLESMEDPKAPSFFRPPSDSYGFGYLAPFMVRDEAWSSLRWAPWAARSKLNIADEARAEAERYLEAMAWLLAGTAAARDGEDEDVQAVIELVASGSNWNLQNLARTEGSGFELTRELYQSRANRISATDATVGPDAASFKELSSLRRLADSLKALPEAVAAVLKERDLYFQLAKVACDKKHLPPEKFRAEIFGRVHEFAIEEARRIKKMGGNSGKAILEVVDALKTLTARLAEPPEGR